MNYDKIISYFQENNDVFTETIEKLDSYNWYLNDDRYYCMEELDELFQGREVSWILARAFFGYDEENWTINASGEKEYGPFNPCRDYFSFNGYGNLVSADYKDYSAFLDHWAVESMSENRNYIDSIDDNNDLSALFDALEDAEGEENKE